MSCTPGWVTQAIRRCLPLGLAHTTSAKIRKTGRRLWESLLVGSRASPNGWLVRATGIPLLRGKPALPPTIVTSTPAAETIGANTRDAYFLFGSQSVIAHRENPAAGREAFIPGSRHHENHPRCTKKPDNASWELPRSRGWASQGRSGSNNDTTLRDPASIPGFQEDNVGTGR